MTARPKASKRPMYEADQHARAAPEPTAEEKAKRMAAEASARQAARTRDALYFKQNLKIADLPDSALVDLYNECLTLLASTKPPEEPPR